jgi:hypothetical protein
MHYSISATLGGWYPFTPRARGLLGTGWSFRLVVGEGSHAIEIVSTNKEFAAGFYE